VWLTRFLTIASQWTVGRAPVRRAILQGLAGVDKLADLAILDMSSLKVNPMAIKGIKVVETSEGAGTICKAH